MSDTLMTQETTRTRTSRLDDLYVRHLPGAVRLGYLLTGQREVAEDLAQEAFIKAAGRFRHLRDPAAFPAYLRRTLVNLHTSRLRRLGRERSVMARTHADQPAAMPPIDEQHSLWQLVLTLPARQRAALVLRYYEDLSEKQAADVLRCTVPAVKALVGRALDALRRDVGSDDE
jgi:RNA polymerase sigma factor (sigma-70 family)